MIHYARKTHQWHHYKLPRYKGVMSVLSGVKSQYRSSASSQVKGDGVVVLIQKQ